MKNSKAERNRTLEITLSDEHRLKPRLLEAAHITSNTDLINRTIHGNLFDVITHIPDRFADLIIIDPPYNLSKDFNGLKFTAVDERKYEEYLESWFDKVCDKLKPSGSMYVCGDWKSTAALQRVISKRLTIINRITWQREKGRGAKSNWKNGMEDIWFAVKNPKDYFFNVEAVKIKRKVIAPYKENGKPKDWIESDEGNFRITYPSNFWDDISIPFWSMPENTEHPTQKPEKLYAKLILASSKPNDIIFDPFLGSGTTSVVAKKLNRRYCGIEINETYCYYAEKRLERAETDCFIQGYHENVFWERNSNISRKNLQVRLENTPINLNDKIIMNKAVTSFVEFFVKNKNVSDKNTLIQLAKDQFRLTQDRKVFYCDFFATRFCYSATGNFSNTVLGLSMLQKYDHIPFFVILVCRNEDNKLFLANSSFLNKISHSSQKLSVDNIVGSFNGSNIMKYICVNDTRIANDETNIDRLFPFHEAFSWKENLERLVNATLNIEPKATKPKFDDLAQMRILNSIERSKAFISSQNFIDLQHNLDDRVEKSKEAILIASHIENVNIRGRLIEAIITSDEAKRIALMKDLSTVEQMLPSYDTKNDLGDFKFEYENGTTHTDIKTKIIYMNSNPKAYNIDKFLATMADGKSIFFIYFIGIDQTGVLKTILCSVYHKPLIKATVTQRHWSGRGTRGTTQFLGKDINNMILTDISFVNNIEDEVANKFLKDLIDK